MVKVLPEVTLSHMTASKRTSGFLLHILCVFNASEGEAFKAFRISLYPLAAGTLELSRMPRLALQCISDAVIKCSVWNRVDWLYKTQHKCICVRWMNCALPTHSQVVTMTFSSKTSPFLFVGGDGLWQTQPGTSACLRPACLAQLQCQESLLISFQGKKGCCVSEWGLMAFLAFVPPFSAG